MPRRLSLVLFTVVPLLVVTAGAAAAHPASAYVRVEPQSGSGGDRVRVIGGDWYPASQVELRWESPEGTLLGQATTDSPTPSPNPAYPDEMLARASFEAYVTIPAAAAGRHMLFAVGRQADGDAATPAAAYEIVVPAGTQDGEVPNAQEQSERGATTQSGDGTDGVGEGTTQPDARSTVSSSEQGSTENVAEGSSDADVASVATAPRATATRERLQIDTAAVRALAYEGLALRSDSTGAAAGSVPREADPVIAEPGTGPPRELLVVGVMLMMAITAVVLRRNRKPALIEAKVSALAPTRDVDQEREAA